MKQQTIKIVIADDDAMMRIGLKAMLPWEQYGYQIVGEAKDGREALALCAQWHPDLLITDMKMGEADGDVYKRQIVGISQGVQPIIGYNFGAKKYDRVKQAYLLAVRWNFVVSAIGLDVYKRQRQGRVLHGGSGVVASRCHDRGTVSAGDERN